MTDPAAALATTYNHVEDWTAATLAAPSGPPQSRIDYTRTKSGLRATVAVATGSDPVQNVAYGYDTVDHLSALAASGPATFNYEYHYDAAGRLISRGSGAGGSGTATSFSWDAGGRLTRMINASPDGGTVFADFRHAYDATGNVSSIEDDRGTTTYTYDALYRLTGVTGPGIDETYAYDAVGNRLSKNGVQSTYDAANRLVSSSDGTTYAYDANGNLVRRTGVGGSTTFAWNARNQLTRIDFPDGTFAAYTYDPEGRRLSKRDRAGAIRYYAYDRGDLVQEIDAAGHVLADYVYDGIDHPLSMTRGGVTYYYVYDRLGSVVGLTDGGGALLVRYRYDPWGNLLATEGDNPGLENPFRFTGREWDAESGLYYYRLRYYDPVVGRFIGRDPLGSGYVYASNNPVNVVDPTGLWEVDWRVVGGVVTGFATGVAIIATLPAEAAAGLVVATTAGAIAAAGAVGAVTGVVIESVVGDPKRSAGERVWEGATQGCKGGLVGGAIGAVLGQTEILKELIINPTKAILKEQLPSGGGSTAGEVLKGTLQHLASLPPSEAGLAVAKLALGAGGAVLLGVETTRGIIWIIDTAANGRKY